ncbi:MAG: pyruvate dehydrogenase (acetyl-transferring), homodimeric type [Candidatus Dadabacteria bacterium]|nr:MAG: pyruvate dehydrogenase (acetyl-transferring), homodimeric type [Candidatus Dadabacteria bacterium]
MKSVDSLKNRRKILDAEREVDLDPEETAEWLSAMSSVISYQGGERALYLMRQLKSLINRVGIEGDEELTTDYINTIPKEKEPPYPGDPVIERTIKSIIRWNAMAMVVAANRREAGIGGHISTYASAATLLEVGFNHFFKARTEKSSGDQVYFQGHASPGVYARAFLEGRLTEEHLKNFRRELASENSLPSYPHPYLMPGFWQFPTVSMGLAPIMAIYQARFNRYLQNRGILDTSDSTVWAFLGDGEMDEPESLGALTLASRENLDNLIFVVNCNLQRLDGPVRGNGKIIQELEAIFKGAGWNVIKVIWGSNWDPLLEADKDGKLVKIMNECVDGEYQKYKASDGKYVRERFFGKDPDVLKMVEHLSDSEIWHLKRGGHDPKKVYAAYWHALNKRNGKPTVVLAKTIKGYGLGEAGEGKNITHQQKKLNEDELKAFRTRFSIPLSDEQVDKLPFYKPSENSREMEYLKKRRESLGGYIPARIVDPTPLPLPEDSIFEEFYKGSGERELSSTMGFVTILSRLLKSSPFGRHIVPIVADEARTFGMEALFRQYGIYSSKGQLYEPVDKSSLMYYHEAKDGQLLEEGLTEAGSLSSFIAAGTSYATHGIHMIPFFAFYSMFGFQRVGDLIWAAADMRTRGFLIGATAGRTTLNGEGLQHQDGHSHIHAMSVPTLQSYDPCFAYEIAVIIKDGIKRMIGEGEDIFYYITCYNENYNHPPMPSGAEEGILKGLYKLKTSEGGKAQINLIASGPIVVEALKAKEWLESEWNIKASVWCATSFKKLREDALAAEKENRQSGTDKRKSYLQEVFEGEGGVFVAATDYISLYPHSIAPWIPGRLIALGTDGFGRSSSRKELREFFGIDSRSIALAGLDALNKEGKLDKKTTARLLKALTEKRRDR